jgi:hypothetical protein
VDPDPGWTKVKKQLKKEKFKDFVCFEEFFDGLDCS